MRHPARDHHPGNARAAANKWMTGGVPNRYRFRSSQTIPRPYPQLGIKAALVQRCCWAGPQSGQTDRGVLSAGGLEQCIDIAPGLDGLLPG